MFITILVLALLLTGLSLLAVGIVLLFKAKNKLAGWIVAAVGLVFTLVSVAIFLSLIITTSIQS